MHTYTHARAPRNSFVYFDIDCVADRSNHVIRRVTVSTGWINTIVGTQTAGRTAQDASKRFVPVCLLAPCCIVTGFVDGVFATAGRLNLPYSVAIDSLSGAMYIAGDIRVCTASGLIVYIFCLHLFTRFFQTSAIASCDLYPRLGYFRQ
jgi:hypothetical protein